MILPMLNPTMSLQLPVDRTVSSMIRDGWWLLCWPVWNHEKRRLRAPLRAVLPLILTFFAFFPIQETVRREFDGKFIVGSLESAGLLAVLIGAILLSAWVIDRRPIKEYGFAFDRDWLRSFAAGSAIATVANAGTLSVAIAAGWVSITGFIGGNGPAPFLPALGVVFVYTTVAASWEEFIMRGGMLKNLAEGANGYLPRWAAVGLAVLGSSAVFAFLHSGKIVHPSQAGYYLVAGLILGGIYAFSGDLALPIGFHVFYNFTMGSVFGLGVSQDAPEVVMLDVIGPAFWIGEEGLARVVFAVVGGVLMLAYVRWRDGNFGLSDQITQWTPRASVEETN
jgi:membrane protease YdiL (CAAX protease family)